MLDLPDLENNCFRYRTKVAFRFILTCTELTPPTKSVLSSEDTGENSSPTLSMCRMLKDY